MSDINNTTTIKNKKPMNIMGDYISVDLAASKQDNKQLAVLLQNEDIKNNIFIYLSTEIRNNNIIAIKSLIEQPTVYEQFDNKNHAILKLVLKLKNIEVLEVFLNNKNTRKIILELLPTCIIEEEFENLNIILNEKFFKSNKNLTFKVSDSINNQLNYLLSIDEIKKSVTPKALYHLFSNIDTSDFEDLLKNPAITENINFIMLVAKKLESNGHSRRSLRLYDYLNDKKYPLSLQDYAFKQSTSRIGHVMGLSKDITLNTVGKKFKFEGWNNQSALCALTKKIKQYMSGISVLDFPDNLNNPTKTTTEKQTINDKKLFSYFEKIYNAFESAANNLFPISNHYQPDKIKNIYNNYHNKNNPQLIFIPSGWPGHTLGLTLYQDYLIVCNRGKGGDQQFGTKIYHLFNPALITEEWIKEITQTQDKAEFNQSLDKILNPSENTRNPICQFPTKGQKRGTCAYVNALSSVEAMLCLLQAEENGGLNDENIRKQSKQPRTIYKNFTTCLRDREMTDIVQDIHEKSPLSPEYENYYSELSKAILQQHNGNSLNVQATKNSHPTIKQQSEQMRGKYLFKNLPPVIQQKISIDIPGFFLNTPQSQNNPVLYLAEEFNKLNI